MQTILVAFIPRSDGNRALKVLGTGLEIDIRLFLEMGQSQRYSRDIIGTNGFATRALISRSYGTPANGLEFIKSYAARQFGGNELFG